MLSLAELRESPLASAAGGRTWWAHFNFTRMNIGPIFLGNQIEDRMEIPELAKSSGAFRTDADFTQCQPVTGVTETLRKSPQQQCGGAPAPDRRPVAQDHVWDAQ